MTRKSEHHSEPRARSTAARAESSMLFDIAHLRSRAAHDARDEGSGLIYQLSLPPLDLEPGAQAPALLAPRRRRRAASVALASIAGCCLAAGGALAAVVAVQLSGDRPSAQPERVQLAPRVRVAHVAPARQPEPGPLPRIAPVVTPPAPSADRPAPPPRAQLPKRTVHRRAPKLVKRPVRVARPVEVKPGTTKVAQPRDELERLVRGALDKRPTAAADKRETLPAKLDRRQIKRALGSRVKQAVKACYQRYRIGGMVMTRIGISPAGKVTAVKIKGRLARTPTGACVARAVKQARFPRFGGPAMSIDFPFFLD